MKVLTLSPILVYKKYKITLIFTELEIVIRDVKKSNRTAFDVVRCSF